MGTKPVATAFQAASASPLVAVTGMSCSFFQDFAESPAYGHLIDMGNWAKLY